MKQTLGKNVSQPIVNKYNIEEYIKDLDLLRDALFGNNTTKIHGMQQFDALDAYLWRVGKVKNGNFSLLFTKKEYVTFINNLSLAHKDIESTEFDKEVVRRCCSMSSTNILQGIYTYTISMHTLIDHCKNI